MGYRCIKDPDLLGIKGKPEYQKLRGGPTQDPRRDTKRVARRMEIPQAKRKRYTSLPLPKLRFDNDTIAPPPESFILIRGFSNLVTKSQLIIALSTYGSIKSCELAIDDKMVSLGAARVQFDGNLAHAHRVASKVINDEVRVYGELVTAEWDESREKLSALIMKAREDFADQILREKREEEFRQREARRKDREALRNEALRNNNRAKEEKHIFIQPLHLRHPYPADFIFALERCLGEKLSPVFNGFCVFLPEDQLLSRFYELRKLQLRVQNQYLNDIMRLRDAIIKPKVRLPSPPPSAPVEQPKETIDGLERELKQKLHNDILTKVIMPTIVDYLQPQKYPSLAPPTHSLKRKPAKLSDLRLHFRKRQKTQEELDEDGSTQKSDSEAEDMSVDEESDDHVDNTAAAFEGMDGRADDETFESEVGPGITVGKVPRSIVDPIDKDKLYLSNFERLLLDESDFQAAKQAASTAGHGIKAERVRTWARIYRDMETRHKQATSPLDNIDPKMLAPQWGGIKPPSFRSTGYTPIKVEDKARYLPHRHAVKEDRDSGEAVAARKREEDRTERLSKRRETRVLNAFEADSLMQNELAKNSKKVTFSQSAIHNWGLYAMEPIAANEMIIEYIGELIRNPLADVRERRYTIEGIGSSYLFRLDRDSVIDATKKGNVARLINHSCDPTCTAKIVTVGETKRICLHAGRDIKAGEEITYDYKFEREDDEDRIPCLCGAATCRGYLN